MPVGLATSLGTTADFTLTRDQLIMAAFQTARVIAEGQALSSEQLAIGIARLGMIVREVDGSGNWIWTVQDASHLTLAAGVGIYEASNGLPTNISELISVSYRNSHGYDSRPLKILKADGYEEIPNKLETGEPCAVYLTGDTELSRRRLYVWPYLSTVTTHSKVLGTDNNIYKCIYPHAGSATSRPITGANWKMAWERSSGTSVTWAANAAYTAGESLRLVIKRPLYDFDSADNTPDFPIQFPRLLMLRLAHDVGMVYGTPPDTLQTISGLIRGSFTDIFPSTKPKTNNIHNKAVYF